MFIAGPYTATYNELDIGITEDGFDLDVTTFQEAIRGDNLGSSQQDAVYRGANQFLSWTSQQWGLSAVKLAYWPWGTSIGHVGQVGVLSTNFAKQLVLTCVAGTTADKTIQFGGVNGAGPATLTASKCILAGDSQLKHIFSTRHRKIALRHQLFPYTDQSSNIIWFLMT